MTKFLSKTKASASTKVFLPFEGLFLYKKRLPRLSVSSDARVFGATSTAFGAVLPIRDVLFISVEIMTID